MNPPMAPNELINAMPAAALIPDNTLVGYVQKTGWQPMNPAVATHSEINPMAAVPLAEKAMPAAANVNAAAPTQAP